jgi:hypothetical protein
MKMPNREKPRKPEVVRLKIQKQKQNNKARQQLVETIQEFLEDIDSGQFPIQGFALTLWTEGGNRTKNSYYSRKDFPVLYIPELVKQSLSRLINS